MPRGVLPECGFIEMTQRLKGHPCKAESWSMIKKTAAGFAVVGVLLSFGIGYKSRRFPMELLSNTAKITSVGVALGIFYGVMNCTDQIGEDVERERSAKELKQYAIKYREANEEKSS